MASPDHNDDEQPSRLGYFAAIFVSALGHAAIFAFVFFIGPRFLRPADAAPPAYTVKIVDNIPAGDLGTHLPRINRHQEEESKPAAAKPEEAKVKTEPAKTELASNEADKNALRINAKPTDAPTPTATPTAEPTIEPTPEPTVEPAPSLEPNLEATEEPTVAPTPAPTPQPTKAKRATPKPKPTPEKARNKPKSESTVAKVASTPSVALKLAKLKKELLARHMKDLAENPPDDEGGDETDTPDATARGEDKGGGPVLANNASEGKGYGVGPGTGSAGILQDPDFLLYYKTVQDQIKKAWSFTGGSNDLTATVDFAIGPDGALHNLKIGTTSNDPTFDDSVLRAIRRAAPFPAPPEKFRDQFSAGIKAEFQLGNLKS